METPLQERLRRLGLEAGLDRVGFAAALPFEDVHAEMQHRASEGLNAELKFTYKDPASATDIRRTFPWARSLVVGIRSYLPEAGFSMRQPGRARIARFAIEDPYRPLGEALDVMASELRAQGSRAEVLADDDRLVDRAAAVRAGVAWWGKSTMAITPGLGPWFVIGSVATDAELQPDAPMKRDCGTCDACLPACPTGALVAPGVLDARKCLAAISQTGGVMPREWREAMGDRLYGCDDCLDACPPGQRLSIRSTRARGNVDLRWIMTAADRTLLDRFGHFYLPGRSPRILRRNALVAIGNDRDPSLFDVAAFHVGHPDWLLRAHAVWALSRFEDPRVRPVLEAQQEHETHPAVIEELTLAVGSGAIPQPANGA